MKCQLTLRFEVSTNLEVSHYGIWGCETNPPPAFVNPDKRGKKATTKKRGSPPLQPEKPGLIYIFGNLRNTILFIIYRFNRVWSVRGFKLMESYDTVGNA